MKNKIQIKIQNIKNSEVKKIASVYKHAFNKVEGNIWNEINSLQLMKYWYKKQKDMFFVAKYKNVIIGGVVAGIKPWFDGNRIIDGELFVDSKYQRLGIGKSLLLKLIKVGMKKYNTKIFEAITFSKNTFPITWYNKIGLKKSKDLVFVLGDCDTILNKLR
jgi:GNAT superfamily N-acetyltransferase